jgi:hypothetical protein
VRRDRTIIPVLCEARVPPVAVVAHDAKTGAFEGVFFLSLSGEASQGKPTHRQGASPKPAAAPSE